jgi:pimeloyl-ACP methyl ester carboxylesterase
MEVAKILSVDTGDGQYSFQFDSSESAEKGPEATPFTVSLLALSAVDGLGHKGIRSLVREFQNDLHNVWATPPKEIAEILSHANVPTADKVAERVTRHSETLTDIVTHQARDLAKRRIWVIPPAELPPRLREIPDPPLWLFVQGRPNVLYERPAIAIVGTREATDHGRRAARIVAELVTIPVAVSVFPGEQYQAPRSWTEKAYPNLIYFNEVDKGGHFAAWEQPQLFSEELRAGFRSLR